MATTTYYPYVGDIGTKIEINMGEDITGWQTDKFTYKVKKGDNSTDTWTATVKGGGGAGDNTLTYTVVSGDFDVEGIYYITPYGENGSGWKGHGRTIKFRVYPLYEGEA